VLVEAPVSALTTRVPHPDHPILDDHFSARGRRHIRA